MQEALEEENKARIEQAKKMDLLIKRMDHTERARRENEAPLLQEAYAQKVKVAFLCFVGLVFDCNTTGELQTAHDLVQSMQQSTQSRRCCQPPDCV